MTVKQEKYRPGFTLAKVGLWLGPLLAGLVLLFFSPTMEMSSGAGATQSAGPMAAIVVLMAVWWISEAAPLAVTSLLPLVLFPLAGIMTGKTVAPLYFNSVIFLLIGGFLIAQSMERHGLHKRIALFIITRFGTNPRLLILGFMLACAFLSMWISNTATAVMMLPIALSLLIKVEERGDKADVRKLTLALLISIAYSCSVGGMGTLIGTPPNLALSVIFHKLFPAAPEIDFARWFFMGLPLVLTMLLIIWVLLTFIMFPLKTKLPLDKSLLKDELQKLGPITREERIILCVFILTALLWIFRRDLTLGTFVLPGWAGLTPVASYIDDGTVAIFMALLLFIIPLPRRPEEVQEQGENRNTRGGSEYRFILNRDAFARLPWSIILLFGGGFALAQGFMTSGLALYLSGAFTAFAGLSQFMLVLIICLGLSFATELTSNTASANLALPVIGTVAVGMGIHPLLLMIPATLATSMAFMMPVATPPNAIIFGSEKLRILDMVKTGLPLNLLGVLLLSLFTFLVIAPVFDIDTTKAPTWAGAASSSPDVGGQAPAASEQTPAASEQTPAASESKNSQGP